MRHKYSPVVLQLLGGSPQNDFEYEKKFQDFKEAKEHMASIKKVIDNFPRKLEGYKQMLDTIAGTCDFVFEQNQKELYQFMHNIASSHRALSEKLSLLFSQFTQLKNSTNIWVKELNSVIDKCRLRNQCKKNYEHYEKKLYDLNTDRMKEIKKKNKISESDHERFIRNIGKFQKSAKEFIFSSNSAYRAMEQFMNNRCDKIIMAMVGLIEAERGFFNEANHIMNFFVNIRNNAINMKKNYINNNTKYDASLYIKGKNMINMSVEEIFSANYKIPPPSQIYPEQGINNNQNGFGNYNNKGIINPFTAESNNNNDFEKNNNMSNIPLNNYNYDNSNSNSFINKSTRETFASKNPYNTQSNSYFGNINNQYQKQNSFNNNFKNPYNDNNINFPNNSFNPFGGSNSNFNENNKNDLSKENNAKSQDKGNNNNDNNDEDDEFNF